MALTPSSSSHTLLQFPLPTHSTTTHCFLFSDVTVSSSLLRSPWAPSLLSSCRSKISAISPIVVSRAKCSAKSTAEEDLLSEPETLASGGGDDDDDAKVQDQSSVAASRPIGSPRVATSLSESLSLGIREPVYEVLVLIYMSSLHLISYYECFDLSTSNDGFLVFLHVWASFIILIYMAYLTVVFYDFPYSCKSNGDPTSGFSLILHPSCSCCTNYAWKFLIKKSFSFGIFFVAYNLCSLYFVDLTV